MQVCISKYRKKYMWFGDFIISFTLPEIVTESQSIVVNNKQSKYETFCCYIL